MSSHHFVREGQEPALLLLEARSWKLVQPLLEWAPLVMVIDTAVDEILMWGIKIDVVLTNSNAVELVREKLKDHGPFKIISCPLKEDPLRVGLDFLISHDQQAVNVIMDIKEQDFGRLQLYAGKLDIVMLDTDMKWSAIASEFRKWLPAGTKLAIWYADEASAFFSGLKKCGPGFLEKEEDGNVQIKSAKPFWIGERLTEEAS